MICLFISFRFLKKTKNAWTVSPKRILLTNCGGLGDLVICREFVIELKRRFPDSQIGFVALKQSKVALEIFPHIDWIHQCTYWVRPDRSRLGRLIDYLTFFFVEETRLAKEIRKIGYDCAFELRPLFPNLTSLILKSKIPVRVGFAPSPSSKLLNHSASWSKDEYLGLQYFTLFETGLRL